MKAGDILAIQDNSSISTVIRLVTISQWSHVGIATSENTVLEATKLNKFDSSSPVEIREVSLNDFISGSTKWIHLIRPTSLSKDQLHRFYEFNKDAKEKNYTTLHAIFTIVPLTIFLTLLCVFVWEVYRLGIYKQYFVSKVAAFLVVMTITGSSIFAFHRFMLWSRCIKLGVSETERIFYKTSVGRWLVDKKHDMFCSKLVALADKAIGGPLNEKLPNDEDVQPEHIVKACIDLGWQIKVTPDHG